MRRFPPAIWILVYVGSVLILNGGHPTWRPVELALGIAMVLTALGLALYLALGPWEGRERPRWGGWAVAGVAACYLIAAAVGWLVADTGIGLAALLGGAVPTTAVALLVALVRSRTPAGAARKNDPTAENEDDPFPSIAADDLTPLGDSPQLHDEISPHDLPKDHPGRKAAERQAAAHGGTTSGNVGSS
jgi:hypothetical protein